MGDRKLPVDMGGTKRWYVGTGLSTRLHRVDGPAIIFPSGAKRWYINNRLHRVDGPAAVEPGLSWWYIRGMNYSQKEWLLKILEGI